jgi:hypothetical protein
MSVVGEGRDTHVGHESIVESEAIGKASELGAIAYLIRRGMHRRGRGQM